MSNHHAKLDRRRWEATRQIVFKRDGYRCMKCGKRGRLEAHHSPPLQAGADPYAVTGILTYCRSCHINHHKTDRVSPARLAWMKFTAELVVKNGR